MKNLCLMVAAAALVITGAGGTLSADAAPTTDTPRASLAVDPGATLESSMRSMTTSNKLGLWVSQPQRLGLGAISSYVTQQDGKLTAIGYAFTASSLQGLPGGHNDGKRCFDVNGNGTIEQMAECVGGYEQRLPLPSTEAYATPYKFGMVNWNPMGHAPIYTSPHFDFHFYLDEPSQVDAIRLGPCWGVTNCDDFQKAIAPVANQFMPQGYQDFQGVEAQMGNHMGDPSSPEFNGQPFTKTFVYGKNDARVTFLEPMITRDYLLGLQNRSQSVCTPINQPQQWQRTGWYPTQYCIRYTSAPSVYRVSLEAFQRG